MGGERAKMSNKMTKSRNVYYVIIYEHKYGCDVIGLFSTEEEARLYADEQIIKHYYLDYARKESDLIPSIEDWNEFTSNREVISIDTVLHPGWWQPNG